MATPASSVRDGAMRLTARQTRFVQSYCGHLNASRAAREAGYAATSGADAVTAHRLLRINKIKAAIEARQQAIAADMELTRQDVIRAILGAIQTAKELGRPAIEIRGWATVSKLAGLDKPEPQTVKPLSAEADLIRRKLESLPTDQLLEMVAKKRAMKLTP